MYKDNRENNQEHRKSIVTRNHGAEKEFHKRGIAKKENVIIQITITSLKFNCE